MRVVHLSTSDRGGAGIAAVRLHLALLAEGVDSHLLTLHRFTENIPNHTKYFPGEGNIFPAIRNGIYKFQKAMKYSGLRSFSFERNARKHLKNRINGFEHFSFPFSNFNIQNHPLIRSADIIHLHWVSDGFLDYESFFTGNKKRIVWTLHDMNPFTGGCHHSDDCMKFKINCELCPQLEGTIDENYSATILTKKIKYLSEITNDQLKIVTPSSWLGSLSKAGILFNKFHHEIIPNAFDKNSFLPINRKEARKILNLPLDKKIILFNAHHIDNPRKGFSILAEAVEKINSPDVLLCASGHLRDTIQSSGIRNLGYLKSDNEMAQAYSAADVFVLPSLAENFPNTICESLMCGTPVVAFRVGGLPELVSESNGFLARLNNTDELAAAILSVLFTSKFDRNKIYSDAVNFFESSVVAKKYINVYSNSLA